LGFGTAVQKYFDEHVEADAVHEHIAARSLCGALVEESPDLHPDVLFGAATCVVLDAVSASELIGQWQDERTGMRRRPLDPAA
jgi:hypothetical protein